MVSLSWFIIYYIMFGGGMLIDWLMNRFAIPSSMILFEWYVSTSIITNSHDDADRSVQIHTKTRQNKIQIREFRNKDCLSVWNGFDESMIIPSIPTLYTFFFFLLYIFYLSNLPTCPTCTLYSVLDKPTRHIKPPHSTPPTNLNVPNPFRGFDIRFVRLSMSGEVRFIIWLLK